MPIRFRCGYCSRLLGIARRKAGTHTACPHCNATIAVPPAEEFEDVGESRPELAEIDRLLQADRGNGSAASPAALASPAANEGFSTAPSPPDLPTPPPSPAIAPRPVAQPQEVLSLADAERPPLERNVGADTATPAPRRKVKVPPKRVALENADEPIPLDDEPLGYVLTPQKMTALAAVGVVLLILAFTAGYFVAR